MHIDPEAPANITNVASLFYSVFQVIRNISKEDWNLNIYILLSPILLPIAKNVTIQAYSLYPDTLHGFQVRKI